MTYDECFLCEKTSFNCLEKLDFVNLSATVPGSQRAVRFVLEHLANCIRTKLIFSSDTTICAICYNELTDYDNLMVKLLASQKRLTSRLQTVLTTKWKDDEEDLENEDADLAATTLDDDDCKMQLVDPSDGENDIKSEPFDYESEVKAEPFEDDEQPIIEADMARDDSEDEDLRPEGGVVLFEGHRRLPQECVVCGEKFKSKLSLHNHITETHNVKVFECKICGAVRKDEEYLELHMNTHEGKTEYECRYCPKRFSRPVNTLRHMRKHWDKKEFQCEKCGERFSLDNMLYNHRLRHEAEENPLICSICNQSFKSRKTYNHHQLTHQKHRPRHQCPICPKSFTERYTLKMHMGTHGITKEPENKVIEETTEVNNEVSEEYACVVCGNKFYTKEQLNTHLKDNHDVILK